MRYLLLVVILLGFVACSQNGINQMKQADAVFEQVKQRYAPDKREALFNVKLFYDKGDIFVKGETNLPEAVDELKTKLSELGFNPIVRVSILPDQKLDGNHHGIINNSVANIRSQAKHSGELATQALLGQVVKVLKQQGEWYLVQTPDQYISWIDHGGLVLTKNIDSWRAAEKVLYIKPFGFSYNAPAGSKVSDLVMGNLLKLEDETNVFYQVSYPDGRLAYVAKNEAMVYSDWLAQLAPSGENVVKIAQEMLGAPYLWGGTSTKGVDCSGFTKTAYLLNGLIIPRDASLQVRAGATVDPGMKFEGLEIGDLLFFGRAATDSTSKRVTHVGLWMGAGQFIHSSKQVRISSINPESEYYDEFNKNRYLGAQRYFGNVKGNLTDLRN